MSAWKEVKLEDICERVTSGGTPSTRRPEYYGGNIPWLKTQEVNFNRIYDTDTKITPEGLENSSAKWIPKNSVIIAMYGATAGRVAINKIPLTTNQACCNLIIDSGKADFRFVYYNLTSRFKSIANMAIGAAQQNLNAGMMKSLIIRLPDLPTQTAIAEILSFLDDKIELNNQINQNLEALAQAIFKRWFVDFEFPNENGQPYKSSGGEMVESELGEIPKGWSVSPVSHFIEVRDGTHDSPKPSDEGFYLITSKHLKPGYIDFESAYRISEHDYVGINRRSKVDKHDILITMIGTVGNFYFVDSEPNYAIKNIGLFKSSQRPDFGFFLYEYLRSPILTRYYSTRLAGSTQQYLTLKILRDTPVLYNEEIGKTFIDVIKPITEARSQKNGENIYLRAIRDLLLPRLISGQLPVLDSPKLASILEL